MAVISGIVAGSMEYHFYSFHPVTDFYLGNIRLADLQVGIKFKADTWA